MDAMAMVRAAFWIFAVAAAGGLLMAGIRLGGNRNPSIAIAYAHGLLTGAGLNRLYHWRLQPLPKGLMSGHSGLALVGVGLLHTAAF